MKRRRYIILDSDSSRLLEEMVNDCMMDGYIPLGAPHVHIYPNDCEYWVQAMVLPEVPAQ